jgi:hypothetical protein
MTTIDEIKKGLPPLRKGESWTVMKVQVQNLPEWEILFESMLTKAERLGVRFYLALPTIKKDVWWAAGKVNSREGLCVFQGSAYILSKLECPQVHIIDMYDTQYI